MKSRIGIIAKGLLAVALITVFAKLHSSDIGFPQEAIRELEQKVFTDRPETMSNDDRHDKVAMSKQKYSDITEPKVSTGGLMLADYEGLPLH
ncbi:MAG: hypothetical protein R6U85_11635 [Salinivirgaceae bacterium]